MEGDYEYKNNTYTVYGVCCISKSSDNRKGVYYISKEGKAYAREYQDFLSKFKKVPFISLLEQVVPADLKLTAQSIVEIMERHRTWGGEIPERYCEIKTDDGWVDGFARTIKTVQGGRRGKSVVVTFMPSAKEFEELKKVLQNPVDYDHIELLGVIYDLAAIIDVAHRKGTLSEFKGWGD